MNLTQREQQVWNRVVVNGQTMADVARQLGVTQPRVRQLRNSAMAKKYKP
ncbi:sigma factor-like helix-turn-helix DNA-binding protein [Paenibacillus sp. FSL P4-0338]